MTNTGLKGFMKDEIKFVDLLKMSNENFRRLKLLFNSNWFYKVKEHSECVSEKLGHTDRYFDLLDMYGSGEAAIVRESVKTHRPEPKRRRFKNGDLVFAFIPYDAEDWLLVSAYEVTDDSKELIDVDESTLADYQKYFGRLIITWKDRSTRNIRMTDEERIKALTVKMILDKPYYARAIKFPGYGNINISFKRLGDVLNLETWQAALGGLQAVYLITDTSNNKRYVGSATGEGGLLARWQNYAKSYHGGDVELKTLSEEHIEKYFHYTILETFGNFVDESDVKRRERWWKEVMLSYTKQYPDFGYNDNIEAE